MTQSPATQLNATRMPLTVAAGAILVMFLWALCFPLINIGLSASPPMAFAAIRAAIAGATLLLIAQWLRRPSIEGARQWVNLVLVGVTATSMGFFGMFSGGGLVAPGLATVISNTQPLIAAVLAWGFLGERLSSIHRWGLAAGFGGIVLIGTPSISGDGSQMLGFIYILLGAFGVAIGNVLLVRLAGRIDIFRAMGWQLLIGSVPLAVLALTTEDITTISWSLPFILSLLILSFLGTAASIVLWFALLRRSTLSRLNVFTFLTPILGLLMGLIFFAERVQGIAMVGIALSLLGIYLVTRPARTRYQAMELVADEVGRNE